ncbi:hypothetical protein VDG1235_2725 [Verrucomicrobiia bacterium DG1235]|nr:hypothetical protein VDG1235_2725 [Verrucomicrobiae bacterium DG1235]
MRILIIGKIWPEPTSSAAGTRTVDLIRALKTASWEIHFACSAQTSPHSANLAHTFEIETHPIELNSSSFDSWLKQLAPDIVIFDRYMTEEQFGWRVATNLPNALRVIDTSDLHCLREARHQNLKTGETPSVRNEIALREIACILRSDLSLIISEYEMKILRQEFPLNDSSITYWPFALGPPLSDSPAFDQRENFMMIGSFMHEPNWDAVRWCQKEIWPAIRSALPHAKLDIYGSYTPAKAKQLHSEKNGFLIKGRADDAISTLKRYRVNLAPLRFGAGLKGKLADAFLAGTPSVATPIAAEGMRGSLPWGSNVSDDPGQFAKTAIQLYTNRSEWSETQSAGYSIAQKRFSESYWLPKLPELLETAYNNRKTNRDNNFIGQLLNHHHHRSTEFMSRWIEAKNK